ncbi:MAG: phosphate ABC transporter permease subunit PstC [Firmicutes bacterium]|nr:phosphate ABC transporter permease subunit PstC [Bacillota bacterium]
MNKKIYRRFSEWFIEKVFTFAALVAVLAVLMISVYIFYSGWPIISRYGLSFIIGTQWYPTQGIFGILPMIIGSFAVTIGALVLGVPMGLAGAIFLAEIAPAEVVRWVRPAVELLAGIPSVVYGFFGLVILVPLIRNVFHGSGYSILAGSIILAVMILPTIITISESSLRAVPLEYKEGSLALGATHWQTISRIMLPAASSGIIAGVVLGMARAIGETMAVIMVTGNVTAIPGSIFDPVRTLTGNVVIEMGYAAGEHQQALFATGMVLFCFIAILNLSVVYITRGSRTA